MHAMIERLLDYHRDKSRQLLALDDAKAALVRDGGNSVTRERLVTILAGFQSGDEAAHHANEELILAQLHTTDAPIHRRIAGLREEHSAFAGIVAKLVQLVRDSSVGVDALRAGIDDFIRHYDDHATGEETIFFPAAEQHLTATHWEAIESRWHG